MFILKIIREKGRHLQKQAHLRWSDGGSAGSMLSEVTGTVSEY
jgi:hypothetical protein